MATLFDQVIELVKNNPDFELENIDDDKDHIMVSFDESEFVEMPRDFCGDNFCLICRNWGHGLDECFQKCIHPSCGYYGIHSSATCCAASDDDNSCEFDEDDEDDEDDEEEEENWEEDWEEEDYGYQNDENHANLYNSLPCEEYPEMYAGYFC